MITRFIKIQLSVFLVIALGALAITGVNYVGLNKMISKPYKVKIYLTETGNVFKNADVTYRGVTVGRVQKVDVATNGAVVTVGIEHQNNHIPKQVRAEVQKLSAVGEQYIDLTPQVSGGPYLKNGDSVPYAMTSTPVDENTVLVHANELVRTIPKGDLVTTVDELGKAFDGLGPDLQRVIDRGNEVITAFQSDLPQTIRLIEEGRVVLNTQIDVGPQFQSFAHDIADVSQTLRDDDSSLRRLLDNGSAAAPELNRLLTDLRPELPLFLGNLIALGQIQAARLPGLDQLLVIYPKVIDGAYATLSDPGKGAKFGIVTDQFPVCTNGYLPKSQQTTATNKKPGKGGNDGAPVRLDLGCKESTGSKVDVRGSRNTPRPAGDTTDPALGGYNYGNASAPSSSGYGTTGSNPTAASITGSGAAPTATGDTGPNVAPPSTNIVDRAAYDPGSGLVTAPDGSQYFLGSNGGQQAVLGNDSWKHLFLAPLTA
ncbi:MAG TPA: MCE family protein [Frankiaceae bacterium]|nr:MCE family protein [Frankiaceae bacterium]